ncbi:MAG: hypothetical protein WD069_22335 [Planctomycetales bacterium]
MLHLCTLMTAALLAAPEAGADQLRVTGIRAEHRHGQTFVTWKDVADGEAGSGYRYSLYRSDQPITADNLDQAELCYHGVLNNSATQFGHSFMMKDRLDETKPRFVLKEGGEPLPMWSGVAVRTAKQEGESYYAVVATDAKWETKLSPIVPGESATTEPVNEKVAPLQPIKIGDSKSRSQYAGSTYISGEEGLPLHLSLHGSQATGGAAAAWGDLYIYFGTPEMGWRDGLPGIFSVSEGHGKDNRHLTLVIRDAIENPRGDRPIETCWFGYYCVPFGAEHTEPRAYPFTENRVAWIVEWVKDRYQADPHRVYSSGQSMGGMGSTQFSFRQPETFAAVYPRLGRVRQSWLPSVGLDLPASIHKASWKEPVPMYDGKSDYFLDRMDSVKWVREHHEDLPFYGWCFGRTDYVAPWQDQIDMVDALTANKHGFAFSWNNHGHSSEGAASMAAINKYYPASKFALDRSYPAFGHSSIDSDLGNGDAKVGDLVGGVNLGFDWSDVVDEADRWSIKLSNALCEADMTVDVTPRRAQKFQAKPGDKFRWTNSAGGEGTVTADQWGLVTIAKATIQPGEATTLTISRER